MNKISNNILGAIVALEGLMLGIFKEMIESNVHNLKHDKEIIL